MKQQTTSIYNDIPALEELLSKIADVKDILSAEAASPVEDSSDHDEEAGGGTDVTKPRTHMSLKKPIVARWNSGFTHTEKYC